MKKRALIFSVIFIATAAAYILLPDTSAITTNELYMIFPIAAILLSLYILRIYRLNSAGDRAQILIAAGLICWGIGEIISYTLINFLKIDSYPSLADAFFLLNVPIFGAGIYEGYVMAEVKLKQVNKTLLGVLLSASLILTGLVAYFGVYQAFDPTADVLTNTVGITYGLTDLVLVVLSLLTFLVAREYKGGKLASFWIIITTGFFCFLIADILFAMYPDLYEQGIVPYKYMDLLWIAASILISFALLENYIHIVELRNKIKLQITQRN